MMFVIIHGILVVELLVGLEFFFGWHSEHWRMLEARRRVLFRVCVCVHVSCLFGVHDIDLLVMFLYFFLQS